MPSIPRVYHKKFVFAEAKHLTDSWRLRDYVKSVLANGVGRYVCQLQRVTLFFCKDWHSSAGVRHFIANDLLDFARANRGTAVYVQPKRFINPYIYGEYLNGRKASVHVRDFSREEVGRWLNYLRTRSGRPIVHFEHDWRTDHPSVQGVWTPFANRDTRFNVVEWPNEELSKNETPRVTATDEVLRLLRESRQTNLHVEEENNENAS